MFKNNLKLIIRKLRKEKLYSFVNIAGLTVGLTAFLLIALYVRDELSYDRFHMNHEELYRVFADDTERDYKSGEIAPDMAAIAWADIPAIKSTLRVSRQGEKNLLNVDEKSIYADKVLFTDANFFEILDFKLLEGTAQSVLSSSLSDSDYKESFRETFWGPKPDWQNHQIEQSNGRGCTVAFVRIHRPIVRYNSML